MPANALEVTDRELKAFTASQNSDQIQISASYKIIIENTGLIPTGSVYISLNKLSPTESDVVFVTGDSVKDASLGRFSSGQSKKATFAFSTSASVSKLNSIAQTACEGSGINLSIDETISGIVFSTTNSKKTEVPVSVNSCSGRITGGTDPISRMPPDPNPGNPPQDGDGDNAGPPRDDNNGSGNTGRVGVPYAVSVDGPTTVEVEKENQWEATAIEAAESDVRYIFNMGDSTENATDNGTVSHTYTQSGSYDILVTMIDKDSGNPLASDRVSVEVVFNMEGGATVTPVQDQDLTIIGSTQVEAGNRNTWAASQDIRDEESVVYRFRWGDGRATASDSNEASHTYDESGTYELELRMLDGDTNEELRSATMTVNVAFSAI
jgi:plastocyanin